MTTNKTNKKPTTTKDDWSVLSTRLPAALAGRMRARCKKQGVKINYFLTEAIKLQLKSGA